ncbi:MAG TPA: phosphoribosylformylglycinamidine cyclo-ligase [Armatimonadota bacterium]|nr:phosphoribosylformylglycinamidine cyclo-ligase [Armatimonadota bacterium]
MSEEITYRDAGVDIDAGIEAVRRMKESVRATYTDSVLTDVGSFGGMFKLNGGFTDPVLVSSIDGVGTKVKVAVAMQKHDTIGKDLVNHCVNDILVQGARPLFFLDYFAAGKLDPIVASEVVRGAADACKEVGCVLIGGETAEMPGVYMEGEYDLAGSIVGVVERDKIIDGSNVVAGDMAVGIASSGLHTNGYSLARHVLLDVAGYKLDQYIPEIGKVLGDELLEPHRCYFNSVWQILNEYEVHAMAHITGGGFYDNLPRVLPADCQITLERRSWVAPPIFQFIQDTGNIPDPEMYRTFNMGVGMVLIVARHRAVEIAQMLEELGERAWIIGEVRKGGREVAVL